jgi:hypothetical protein
MERMHFRWIVLVVAFAVMMLGPATVEAQPSTGPSPDELEDLARDFGMDPAKCNAVQKQIDQVVAVYQSGLSDDEKIAGLSALWAQSAASLQKSAAADSEVASTANQYVLMMEELVAMAKDSPSGSDKNVSVAAKNSLNKLRALTQNYVKMMKVMCPKLNLPAVMNQ